MLKKVELMKNLNELIMASVLPRKSSAMQLKFSQLSLQEEVVIKSRDHLSFDIQISQPGINSNKRYIRSFNSWEKNYLTVIQTKEKLLIFSLRLKPE